MLLLRRRVLCGRLMLLHFGVSHPIGTIFLRTRLLRRRALRLDVLLRFGTGRAIDAILRRSLLGNVGTRYGRGPLL